jgi:CRP/FNR family cyclic AMP-dependent transcriptional regulator
MIRILRGDCLSSNVFVSYLLSVIKKHEERLSDFVQDSGEQRLAHVLIRLGQLTAKGGRIPRISQSDLANMTGMTRGRVNAFMNRFRKRGFIDYDGRITVHNSLRIAFSHV